MILTEPWKDALDIDVYGSAWSLDEVLSLPPQYRAQRAAIARDVARARADERSTMFKAVMDGFRSLLKAWR